MRGYLTCSGLAALTMALLAGTAMASDTAPAQVAQAPAAAGKAAQPPAPGLPVLDEGVSPCDNFFMHACGPWIAAHPIPEDQSRWGSFNLLSESNQALLRTVLEKAAANPSGDTAKIGTFYAACMDEAGIEKKGLTPIQPILDRINGLKDKKELATLVADLQKHGVGAFFRFGSEQDLKDVTQVIAAFDQGGLGLPDRDFYFKDDEKAKSQREAYRAHITRMFTLAGLSEAEAAKQAEAVFRVETSLAEASMDRVSRRDPEKVYNPTTIKEFSIPGFDLASYVQTIGAPELDKLNIGSPAFFEQLGTVLNESSLDDLKAYLTWHTLSDAAPWLPDAFVQENFAFYGRTLSGAQELRPRWKRCVSATDQALGEDLGKHFVEAAFGPDQKDRTLQMVEDIQEAFNANLATLQWMSPETQERARTKLKAMANKIGYPEEWRDYSKLEVKAGDMMGNAMRASAFETERDLDKIGKPVDEDEWFMSPPTVNAYYSPTFNDINFPAGILQPPFFDPKADPAYNYGAIGSVIGHEITHGFDDQGRKFDADGNLTDWWTEADAERFTERTQCLVDQYSNYVAEGDVKLNGKLSLGENTADHGGTRIALQALRQRLGEKGMAEKIGGLTADQRFFYGWAHVWCSAYRPEARRLQAMTGPHSLPEYRVNGVVSNSADFAKAFNCKPGDAMVRETQCKVW
ncbi:M13 family metallopeptidase [Indioceanicola profundi]|uniref:M13 family metallopeptidase n=1 Tax=Indioceanicola profundi TaxID=2220096 RepID=UPI000E6AC3DB|nr:M13 family metallopeptidase [Indioceanicola profundi]